MPISYLHTSPAVPPRPPVIAVPRVPRTAVSARLERATELPVSVVQAPRGFGKTDALWAWASETALDVEWLALPGDASVDQLCALLRATGTRIGDEAYVEPSARRSVLVVDGLASAHTAEVRSAVLALAGALGTHRIILSTREPLPSDLVAAVGGSAPVITPADLEFSDAEVASLAEVLAAPGAAPLPAGALESIARVTGRWPLGLRLVLQRAGTAASATWSDVRDFTLHVAHDLVDDLQRHPGFPDLVRASVPDRFPASARTLLDDPTILDLAERDGLGWWERDGTRRAFVVQPLVRDLMLEGVAEEIRHQTLGGIARVHLSEGRVRDAFASAVQGADWALAHQCASADLIEVTALMSAEPQLLSQVPKAVLRRVPLLAMLSALGLYIQGRTASAMGAFGRVVAEVERTRVFSRADPAPEHVWLQGMLTVGLRVLGRYELVRPALRRFISMLELATQHSTELDRAEDLFYTESAVTMMQLGDPAAAIEYLERRPLRGVRTKRQHFYGDALYLQALVAQGELRRARERRAEFDARALPPHFADSFYAIPLHIASAYLHIDAGDVGAASAALAHTDRHWTTAENWPFILLARTDVCWVAEGAQAALRMFTNLRAEQSGRAGLSKPVEALLSAQLAQLRAATGSPGDALKRLPHRARELTAGSTRPLLQLLAGAPSAALGEAEQVLQRTDRTVRHTVELHVISATAAHRLSDERRRAHHAERAETLAVRAGLRAPFGFVGVEERPAVFAGTSSITELLADVPAYFEAPAQRPRLTKKELIALHELMQGASTTECARRRSVSVNTVKSQRRSLYRKLDVSRASEAVHRARELGLV